MYNLHNSRQLITAFRTKPFQGAEPEEARFLFIGLDANYAEDIERSAIFPQLLEYLEDGPAFWVKYGVHHPFLLPQYGGAGRKYHKTFAEIGFLPEDAEKVSFFELLHVPTEGSENPLTKNDLDAAHLSRLNRAILHGRAEFVFISSKVGHLMKASKCFPWIPAKPVDEDGPLKIWLRTGSKTVYWHYHFSVYGAYEQQKKEQITAIAALRRR